LIFAFNFAAYLEVTWSCPGVYQAKKKGDLCPRFVFGVGRVALAVFLDLLVQLFDVELWIEQADSIWSSVPRMS